MKYPSDLRDDTRFKSVELWKREHKLNSTRRTHSILEAKNQKSELRKIMPNIRWDDELFLKYNPY